MGPSEQVRLYREDNRSFTWKDGNEWSYRERYPVKMKKNMGITKVRKMDNRKSCPVGSLL